MKLVFIIISLLFLNCNFSFAQEDKFCFEKINIKDAFVIEEKLNSEHYNKEAKVYLGEDFVPNAKEISRVLALPHVFFRNDSSVAPLLVEYFYSINDSSVKLIDYQWDKLNYSIYKNSHWDNKVDKSEKNNYYAKFDSLNMVLTNLLGEPEEGNGKEETHIEDYSTWYSRYFIWKKDDLYVRLSIVWGSGTHRIRVTVTWF